MAKHIVIAGGGVAGMEAAGALAEMGHRVSIIEKEKNPGGQISNWHALFPDRRPAGEVKSYLMQRVARENIKLITATTVEEISRNDHGMTVKVSDGSSLNADAVIVATGFDLFDARRKEEYGYGIYDNVITSADLERMFNDDSLLTSDGRVPVRIGFVHCVGSRDEKVCNNHCSKVCCVTAVKQAIEVREKLPGCEVFCFYMDMRMFGPYYEELYRESQETYNVNYIRGKVSEASATLNNRVTLKVEDTLAGRPLKMEVDLLVLMVGMEISDPGARLAKASGFHTGINRFLEAEDHHYGSNISKMEGVFYAGTCTAPMNITDTISHARSAAVETMNYLSSK
ncbi:MAG: CoB--CoM heterodisulfide reductase iron-sulfur subunit A family protein [Bacteroidales bacterium]|nr:CoB--CoM heterodisulfide reductase iron-sulfur subunit A family protein [Bacteroidales bacterium]